MKTQEALNIDGKTIAVSNLDKIFWPSPVITKADLIKYYAAVAPVALKHWSSRPLTLQRYPNGIEDEGFYQKNCPDYAPEWIRRFPKVTDTKTIEYIICNDLATLVWLGNQGVLEIHPALYKVDHFPAPSFAVIDLDPTAPLGFAAARETAKKVKVVLDELGLRGYPKTSGASGIHIYIPLQPRYSFRHTSRLVEFIGSLLVKFYPQSVTNERLIRNRHGVYVDHLQNDANKTIVGVYSPRPLPSAPVSTPINWDELDQINPEDFNLLTVPQRIESYGDLFEPVLTDLQSIDHLLRLFP